MRQGGGAVADSNAFLDFSIPRKLPFIKGNISCIDILSKKGGSPKITTIGNFDGNDDR